MKYSTLIPSALMGLAALAGTQSRADNMASIAITPATGVVTLTPHWAVGPNLGGFHFMAQDLSLGGGPTQFYSLKDTAIPNGGDTSAFTAYIAASGAATAHADIGSKLTPNSYSALTSADPDLGFGSVQLYFIHHKSDGDYFSHLVPGSGVSSAVTDLKPMSQPGGPSTGGASGYFGLTFSADNLGSGANMFYYLRHDAVTNTTWFGSLSPALAGTGTDLFNLGVTGHNALAYTTTDVGYGLNKMYYLRLDPITGFTIMGTLHPVSGKASDIANLGSVYSTLTFVPGDVSFGTNKFYTTGSVNATAQTVSFAAIADRDTSTGSFTVNPTASSALAVTLKVVPGSVGAASISGPVAGVFTVTPTAPGLITLEAAQAGAAAPIAYEANMLRQSFTITGSTLLAITTQPIAQSVVTGGTVNLSVVAGGTTPVTYQWRKDGADILLNASATTDTLTITNAQAADSASYDVVVTNASGSIPSDAVTLSVNVPAPDAPIVTNPTLTATGTVHTAFSYTITASNTPDSYDASPLPAGLSIDTATGVISGIPAAAGTFFVQLSATNITGTGNAALTLTVADTVQVTVQGPTVAPISLTNDGLPPPAGTVYTAKGLPAGFVIDPATGLITSTGVTAKPGTYTVTYNTVTTDINGVKTKGPVMTLRITVNPLPAGLSGSFETLLEVFPAPGMPAGKLALLVNSGNGAFTGTLTYADRVKPYALKGVLSVDSTSTSATASVTIQRGAGLNPYRLDLLIDTLAATDQVLLASLQQLDNAHTVVSTLAESDTGVQLPRYTASSPAPWQGVYTFLLDDAITAPLNLGAPPAPEGTGYGRVTIKGAGGLLTISGVLGDGTPLTAGLSPAADGSYRWYVKPYKNGGSFGGWIKFTPVAGGVAPYQVATSANSELYWSKSPSAKDKSYRAGFGPVVIVATAQRWVAPAAGTTLSALLQLADSSVQSSFTSASLPGADALLVPSALGINDKNKFVVIAPAANSSDFAARAHRFNGSFTSTNGAFSGSFTLQDGRKVPVGGMFVQQPAVVSGGVIGEGYFVIPPATRGAESVTGKVQFLAP